MKRAAAVLAFLVAACGPGEWVEWNRVRGPDGSRDWFVITCRFRADCIEQAGRLCRYGYTHPSNVDDVPTREKQGTMLVRCSSPPTSPQAAAPSSSSTPPPPAPTSSAIPVREFPE